MLCYANSSALYAENDPFLPFFEQNRLYFIILLPSFLSAKKKAVIRPTFDGASVFVCAPAERRGCFASEFLSCVKGIAFFGAEFNEMINDPQDSHSQQGEEERMSAPKTQ